ncbi:MAG: glycosyltransferase family 2 protein [Bacteroidales bacterium]|nr:glycosyltransferase family 2 protein [Bacteroidales bacterium]
MAEISVIIPVFNTEQYLDRCLDSVLGQTFQDIEVICVDDVSTDGSAALIERRAGKDSRLRYIRQEANAGPGKARNRGIEAANGRYVYFQDSDDWIEPDLLSRMHQMAAGTGRDVIINSSFVKEYEGTGRKEYGTRFGFLEDEPRAYDTATVLLLFPPVLWARLYRRSYLTDNNIWFPDLSGGGEDNYFTTLAELPLSDLFVFRGPYYHYFQRDNSLAHIKEAGYDFIKSFKALYDELLLRSLPVQGIRLFYAGPLVIDSEEKFNYIRSFLQEIRQQVLDHSERYIALDLYLLEAVTSSPDYRHFLASHNPNISIDFIRNRMKQTLRK